MSKKLQDLFELNVANGDKNKAYYDEAWKAVQEATSSVDCYKKLFDFILGFAKPAQAGTATGSSSSQASSDANDFKRWLPESDESKYVGHLEKVNGTDTSIQYKLSPKGVEEFGKDILELKETTFKQIGKQYGLEQGNSDQPIDERITGEERKLKDKKYVEELTELRAKFSKDKTLTEDNKKDYADWIFSETLPQEEGDASIRIIVQHIARERIEKLRSQESRKKTQNAMTDLCEKYPHFNITAPQSLSSSEVRKFYNELGGAMTGKTKGDIGELLKDTGLFIISNNKSSDGPSPAKGVIKNAFKDIQGKIHRDRGITSLERLRKIPSGPSNVPRKVVVMLKETADKTLRALPLKRKGESSRFTDVRLFVFDDDSDSGVQALDLVKNDFCARPSLDVIEQAEEVVKLNFSANDGAFFFVDNGAPNMVHAKGKIIDYDEKTINGESQEGGGKTFTASVRQALDLGEKYSYALWRALYKVNGDGKLETKLIWEKAGGGHGIGRADKAGDYLWCYEGKKGNNGYEDLGKFLGLAGNEISKTSAGKWTLAGKSIDIIEWSADTAESRTNFIDTVLVVKDDNKEQVDYYVEVNLPAVDTFRIFLEQRKGTSGKQKGKTLSDEIKWADEIFKLRYFRKLTPVGESYRVVKAKDDNKNKPSEVDDGEIRLNLPVDLRIASNRDKFFQTKRDYAPIKNKGNDLFKEKSVRKNAGTVMGAIREYIEDKVGIGGSGPLSATRFANAVFSREDSKALKSWQSLKKTDSGSLPTNQEWCHLRGHGDSGEERVGNFVSGSYHCNTEQLAIEMGQRLTTHKGTAGDFKLKSTAYLIPDDSMGGKNGGGYLSTDPEYQAMAYENNKKLTGSAATENTGSAAAKDSGVDLNAPIVAFIRYKVFKGEGEGEKRKYHKMFDYTFEGQSEFFDVNQYRIINATVRFLLQGETAFEQWYKGMKEAQGMKKE